MWNASLKRNYIPLGGRIRKVRATQEYLTTKV